MINRILNIGIDKSLDLEDRARMKLQNSMALYSSILILFFVLYHFFYTRNFDIAFIYLAFTLLVPILFLFQFKKKYIAARTVLFVFFYSIVMLVSLKLLVGHGNEYYYITISILVLILNKNRYWTAAIILFNIFLFLLPHFLYPNIQEEFIVSTHIAVFASALLAVLFFINIQIKFRKKLKEQKEHLEILNQEKNELMNIVAHDLKTPLAQIQGLVNILQLDHSILNKEQLELLEKIKGVSENQYRQISSFLDLNALEENMEEVVFENIALISSIKSVFAEMATSANSKNIKLIDTYNADSIEVYGSKIGLYKIISNLISNAIKFSYQDSI